MVHGEGQAAWLALLTVVAFGALALAIVALVLATGDDGGGDGGGGAASGGPTDQLQISASEFAFDPADAEVFADQEATVTLVNDGSVDHNWTVLEAGTTIASESEFDESMVLAVVGDAAAGESVEGSVTLEPGEYQFMCTISGHFDAGMQGTVVAGG
jgi:plastocyanin